MSLFANISSPLFFLENIFMRSLSVIQFLLQVTVIRVLYLPSEFKISIKNSALGLSWVATQRLW